MKCDMGYRALRGADSDNQDVSYVGLFGLGFYVFMQIPVGPTICKSLCMSIWFPLDLIFL